MENINEKMDQLIDKFNQAKKQEKMDLSSDEDLSIAIMNLVSIEEHFFFTAEKTGKDVYFDLLKEVREMRKELLKKIIKEYEGEVWCISKHLLAASYRLMEVGNKALGQDKKQEAKEFFNKAYQLYTLFWGINMKIINMSKIKKIEEGTINNTDTNKKSIWGKLGELVKKAMDCCIE